MHPQIKRQMEFIRQENEALNAIVTYAEIAPQLKELDPALAQQPFYQALIAVKDNICTKGLKTTASSQLLADYVPIYDATVVEKLKQAGFIIAAKTSLDELAMGGNNLSAATGPVANPYDLARVAGGSSGGSAALVASGAIKYALGSDTGDSIRKPASYLSIVGVKPTYGRISRFGVIPYAASLDHVGYFTRDVRDAAKLLQVLAGHDPKDLTSSTKPVEDYESYLTNDLQNVTIGVLANVYELLTGEHLAALDLLIKQLAEKGAIIRFIRLKDELMEAMLGTYYVLANSEATANSANLDGLRFGLQLPGETYQAVMKNTRTAGFSWAVKKRLIFGNYALEQADGELYQQALKARQLIISEFEAAFAEIDCLLTIGHVAKPALIKGPAEPVSLKENLIIENSLVFANLTGYPSITVPLTFIEGLPVGVNLSAKPFEEGKLFNYCYAVEQLVGLNPEMKRRKSYEL